MKKTNRKKIYTTICAIALIFVLIVLFAFVQFYSIYGKVMFIAPVFQQEKIKSYARNSSNAIDNCTVFLGDSLTEMYDIDKHFSNIVTINRGVAGEETSSMLARLDSNVFPLQPTNIVFLGGTNDLGHGKTIQETFSNITKIIFSIQKNLPNCNIIVQSLYPVEFSTKLWGKNFAGNRNNQDIVTLNALIKDFCYDNNISYADIFSVISLPDNSLSPCFSVDGIHMDSSTYYAISSIIKPFIVL